MSLVPTTKLWVALAAVARVTLAFEASAYADPNACAPNATVGQGCSNAGSTENQFGTCQMTAASHGPGCMAEAEDASAEATDASAATSTCLTCIESADQGKGCGSEGPGDLSGAAFFKQPQVSGCCSVAGRSDWSDGAGLVAGAALLGLVVVRRRKRVA